MLIVQFSDLHICDEGALYKNVVSSNAMAVAAVDHINGLDPQPALVVLTGDIVEDGTASQYAVARRILAQLRAPWVMIPGNHDDRNALRKAFPDHLYMPQAGPINFVHDELPVRVIALDVTVPGAHHGEVGDESLAWLADVLGRDTAKPTVIAMHQPPFACSVPYLDKYMCMQPERLGALLQQHDNVERVLCGHVHRSMQRLWAGTMVSTCPAAATQIALQLRPDAQPASFLEPPGVLIHHWSEAEGLVTHTSSIGTFEGPFPFA
jgi:3',5'-cyclic AMP phosphodiesterase CpdA